MQTATRTGRPARQTLDLNAERKGKTKPPFMNCADLRNLRGWVFGISTEKSGDQGGRESGNQEIRKSGNQGIRESGNQEIRKSGNQEIRKSGNREIGKSGNREIGDLELGIGNWELGIGAAFDGAGRQRKKAEPMEITAAPTFFSGGISPNGPITARHARKRRRESGPVSRNRPAFRPRNAPELGELSTDFS